MIEGRGYCSSCVHGIRLMLAMVALIMTSGCSEPECDRRHVEIRKVSDDREARDEGPRFGLRLRRSDHLVRITLDRTTLFHGRIPYGMYLFFDAAGNVGRYVEPDPDYFTIDSLDMSVHHVCRITYAGSCYEFDIDPTYHWMEIDPAEKGMSVEARRNLPIICLM